MPESLFLLPERYAICRLDADAESLGWAANGTLVSITRADEELSVVCPGAIVPEGVISEGGWIAAKVSGPLPLNATGILSSILDPLAQADVSVFTSSTFDTNYILIRHTALGKAIHALESTGHLVTE